MTSSGLGGSAVGTVYDMAGPELVDGVEGNRGGYSSPSLRAKNPSLLMTFRGMALLVL